ncbi:glycoside hydrolase family 53 protein [Rugosimonospora africana]|uniref:Arabinogalactan endo-beta-1,4-galactanase n=1 Tax=Rugosimonospora africana TaxID=556532 RepID=A0A8J3QV12_9ACTN|nr:arabinogalactan endo-1,4-beta-galactosidase [Rugosimonospora africana]GIH15336.1 arabinogalactan endo-beta-1,4-galactanase [Rugosimonospora africana]
MRPTVFLRAGMAGVLCAAMLTGIGQAPAQAATPLSIRGADLSTLQRAEDLGARYSNQNGTQGDAMQILKAAGMNYVRLRIWVNPASGYNNQAKVVAFARQVKAAGLKLLVDFHYSDTWADPGHQATPAAWRNDNLSQLETAVYNYTYSVCDALRAAGATADMVQVGNEINSGMLWPVGQLTGGTGGWSNLAGLLVSGYNAVKAVSASTQVMLHIANGGMDSQARWWFDEAVAYHVPFDVIGLSYYSYWSGTFSGLQTTLADLASRYGKPIVIAETAYPFTLGNADSQGNNISSSSQLTSGYPATEAGQRTNFLAVINAIKAVPNGRGLGYFYWEPTWTAVAGNGWDPTNPNSGDGWDNQALFNWSGQALSGITDFAN